MLGCAVISKLMISDGKEIVMNPPLDRQFSLGSVATGTSRSHWTIATVSPNLYNLLYTAL